MKKVFIAAGMLSGLLFAGCYPQPQNTTQTKAPVYQKPSNSGSCVISNNPGTKKSCILRVEVVGVGVAPANGMESTAQAMAMARRAAILEGYKALAEKLYGVKINGRETLKNMMLQNESLRAYIQGVIRGANIEEESFKDGMYRVVMSLKVNVNEWNKYLENNPPYSLSSM